MGSALSFSELSAQTLKADSIISIEFIDTLFIDRDIANWSVRAVGMMKDQQYTLSEGTTQQATLRPNNPFSVGVGVASSKLTLDLGYNWRGNLDESTERFVMQLNLMLKQHNLGLSYLSYTGYNLEGSSDSKNTFRSDIRSIDAHLHYTYLFNQKKYSIQALQTGLSRQKKSAITPVLGGYTLYRLIEADSAIVGDGFFGEEFLSNQLKGQQSMGIGLIGGISSLIVLPANFFISADVIPGVGVSYSRNDFIDEESTVRQPMAFRLITRASIGYNGYRIYVNLAPEFTRYTTFVNTGTLLHQDLLNVKLAVGYKLGGFKKSK